MQAPDFSLPDQQGTIHTLSQYRGKWVVLYFYPKDNTPGCTKEACSFRDVKLQFGEAIILGVSKDSIESHAKFAQKYHLNFPLLSDISGDTIKAYNAWGSKKFMGREFFGIIRNTYLIDPTGVIVKTYERVNPLTHASSILKDIPV